MTDQVPAGFLPGGLPRKLAGYRSLCPASPRKPAGARLPGQRTARAARVVGALRVSPPPTPTRKPRAFREPRRLRSGSLTSCSFRAVRVASKRCSLFCAWLSSVGRCMAKASLTSARCFSRSTWSSWRPARAACSLSLTLQRSQPPSRCWWWCCCLPVSIFPRRSQTTAMPGNAGTCCFGKKGQERAKKKRRREQQPLASPSAKTE